MRRIRCTCGYGHERRSEILKAANRAGSSKTRRARSLVALADAMENSVTLSVNRGIATFRRRLPGEEIERLLEEGRFNDAIDVIPWERLEDDIRPIGDGVETATLRGSEFAISELGPPARALVIARSNPRLRRFISDQVGALITDISEQSRRSVASAISMSFQQAMTPRQTAKVVREAVGITERQAIRIMATRQREMAERLILARRLEGLKDKSGPMAASMRSRLSTLTEPQLDRRMAKRMSSAQRSRSIAIARTELTSAVNEGQEIVWAEAADRGLIDRQRSFKVWVTVPDGDRTDICAALDGQRVPLDGTFYSEVTGESMSRPPAHINCRSSIVIEQE